MANHNIKNYFIAFLMFGTCVMLSINQQVNAQCVLPTYDVVIGSPTSNTSWTPAGSGTTGGTRSKVVQIHSSPDIFMRITFIARSSSSVTLSNWDQTPASPLDKTRGYTESWQPIVRFPSSNSATDTAWAEFLVEFASKNGSGSNSFDNNLDTFPCLPVTIIDLDGSGSSTGSNAFQEINYVSAPSVPFGIPGSTISSGMVGSWVVNVSDFPVFNNIDTINKVAMVQMNFSSMQFFQIRAGVIGRRRNNPTERQYSFWLKPFDSLTSYLPVHYLNQTVSGTTHSVLYDWSTAQEDNNSHFEIERSSDGVFWSNIGTVSGCGTCVEGQTYQFEDEAPMNGYNLYRLKQFDFNGKFQYSPIVKYFWENPLNQIRVLPNPINDQVHIVGVDLPDIKIISVVGAVVLEQKRVQQLDVRALPAGLYFIEISNGLGSTQRVVQRIVKQ
ncbi:MAG: T9SS type A sorting domain-containing protein [Bacteroidia bacterium]|nr:T9SS type A sorting domain-containing protein [Bacteroidia bacterium]